MTISIESPIIGTNAGSPRDTADVLRMGIALQLAPLPATLIALALDERTVNGINVWIKPLKFELSMALNLATLLVLLPVLTDAMRASRLVRWSAVAVSFASTCEIAYIVIQSARGVGSHYNVATGAEAAGYMLMGVGAVTMVTSSFLIGTAFARGPRVAGREGLRLGAAAGLMAGSVLTLITAGLLSRGLDGPGHWVGGMRTDIGGMAITGWSQTGGDLRVPHFFATHLMQALPLLGLAVDRLALPAPRAWIVAGLLIGTATVAVTFAQAVAGMPFPW